MQKRGNFRQHVSRRYRAVESALPEGVNLPLDQRPEYRLLPASWKNPNYRPERPLPWQAEMLQEYDRDPNEHLWYFKDFRLPNDPLEHPRHRFRDRNLHLAKTFDDEDGPSTSRAHHEHVRGDGWLRPELQDRHSENLRRSAPLNIPGPRDSAHLFGSQPPRGSFLAERMFMMDIDGRNQDEEVRPSSTRKEECGRKGKMCDANRRRIHKSLCSIENMLSEMKQKLAL